MGKLLVPGGKSSMFESCMKLTFIFPPGLKYNTISFLHSGFSTLVRACMVHFCSLLCSTYS